MYPVETDGKAEHIMARFTEEEQRILKLNRNVAYVSDIQVVFTPEFKRMASEEQRCGKPVRQIFAENGIDPEILGKKRLDNFSCMLRRCRQKGGDFTDRRSRTDRSDGEEEQGTEDLEEQVRWLKHELEYTRQEVEFLKKIQMANTEARKQWESKHRPT